MKIGPLNFYWAHLPVNGWLPHVTHYSHLRDGVKWLIEWRCWWFWWER